MEIKFRKKTKSEWAVLFILFMPFLFPMLIQGFGFPDWITYSMDICWVMLLVSILNKKRQFVMPTAKKLLTISGVFFALTLVGFLCNYQSVLYYLWGMRNNIRFFVYFFACIFFLSSESIEHYLKFFDLMFWINTPVMLYQYIYLELDQDNLGGIFGVERGCNAYFNILLIIVTTKSVLFCLNNKETLINCLIKCGIAVLLAAFAELKAFYIEFAVIVALAMCFAKASYKKFWITVGAVVGVIAGVRLIGILFPVFKEWFTLKNIWSTLTSSKGYTAKNDMNRLTAVSIALNKFLPDLHTKLFGLGLGNCDYAQFDFLKTPFYKAYGGLNYMWFSSAFLLLETGLVGMGLYIYFFVQMFLSAWKISKKHDEMSLYAQLGMICVVMCGFIFVLNASLRDEAAFMMFFVLSFPFIQKGKEETVAPGSIDMQNMK